MILIMRGSNRKNVHIVLKKEKMTEDETVLQTCLRRGLYDSMCDETGEIGIKINLDKTPILVEEK